eukprot:507099_1
MVDVSHETYRTLTMRILFDDSINYRLNDCTPPNVPGSDDVNSSDDNSISAPESDGFPSNESTSSDPDDVNAAGDDSKVFVEWQYKIAYKDFTVKPTKDNSNGVVEMTRSEAVTQLFDMRKIYNDSDVNGRLSYLSFLVRKNIQSDYLFKTHCNGVGDSKYYEKGNAGQKFEEDVNNKFEQWEKEQDAQPL